MDKGKGKRRGLIIWIISGLLLIFITVVVVPLVLSAVLADEKFESTAAYVSAVTEIVFVFGFGYFLTWKFHLPDFLGGFRGKVSAKGIFQSIVLALLVYSGARTLADSFRWIYIGLTDDFEIYSSAAPMSAREFIGTIILLGVIPAICEEVFYRHAALHLMAGCKISVAVAVSSGLFCLAHFASGAESMLYALCFGIAAMLIYYFSKSLALAMLAHFMFNAVSLFFTYVIYWPTDCIYISTRASSGEVCIFWGIIYVAAAAAAAALAVLILNMMEKQRFQLADADKQSLSARRRPY